MNSNSKYQENEQIKASESENLSGASAILQAKINNQIKGYQMRKLSAQDELSNFARVLPVDLDDYSYMADIRKRVVVLRDEIDFCKKQIIAYQTNDNKAKIIPDRLL